MLTYSKNNLSTYRLACIGLFRTRLCRVRLYLVTGAVKLLSKLRMVMVLLFRFLQIFAILAQEASSNDNGLGNTPPMGWRSWNQYFGDVDQSLMERIMEGMVNRARFGHTGQPTSLCELGYCDVGLDDNWQECGSPEAAPGMNYHDINGNPIVNRKRFPDLKQMTDFAHSAFARTCVATKRNAKCRSRPTCKHLSATDLTHGS